MVRRLFMPVSAMAVAVCCGCASTHHRDAFMADAQVSVRFVVSPTPTSFTEASSDAAGPRLVSDVLGGGMADEPVWSSAGGPEPSPYHVVLWGGAYGGANVTNAAVALPSGPYVFGLFDQELGAAYQGWINVNHPGDDLVSVLTSWRDAVKEQKQWLGFDQKIGGAFNSPSHRPFKTFQKQIKSLNRLQRRIERALAAEKKDVARRNKDQARFLESADVLLMPGTGDFFRPATRPAFADAELASIRDGNPLTKVVLIADYNATKEKLRRVNELREDLERGREVFIEEGKRLKRLKGYYAITNHLYNNNKKFIECERRLQEVRGLIAQADRQIKEHRQRCRALTFIAALFSSDDATGAFGDDMRMLQRRRIVLEEHQRRFDLKLAAVDPKSPKRAAVQRDRQEAIARIEAIDKELADIVDARVALATLKDSTSIIHRYGTARIMTAALMDRTIPDYLVDAIEREALMTVRLQETDSLYTPTKTVTTGYITSPVMATGSSPSFFGQDSGNGQSFSNGSSHGSGFSSANAKSEPKPKPKPKAKKAGWWCQ
ncbi:MAG: hypothetical protein ACE5E5_07175 [Phycisphaerae bacterium]